MFDFGIEHVTDRINTPVQSIWFRNTPDRYYDYDTSTGTWV